MKSGFKFFSLGILIIAFYSVAADSIFAQATLEDCQKIFQKFLENRKGPEIEKLKTALATGKEYLEKCSQNGEPIYNDYITKQISIINDKIAHSTLAQSTLEECGKIYDKFLQNRQGPEREKYHTAIVIGEEYLEKCSNLKDQEAVKDYVAS